MFNLFKSSLGLGYNLEDFNGTWESTINTDFAKIESLEICIYSKSSKNVRASGVLKFDKFTPYFLSASQLGIEYESELYIKGDKIYSNNTFLHVVYRSLVPQEYIDALLKEAKKAHCSEIIHFDNKKIVMKENDIISTSNKISDKLASAEDFEAFALEGLDLTKFTRNDIQVEDITTETEKPKFTFASLLGSLKN